MKLIFYFRFPICNTQIEKMAKRILNVKFNRLINYFYKVLLFWKKNDLIYTPPMEIHATYFPKNTVLIVSSKNPRDQATYERGTVRVEMINKKNINHLLKKNGW